MQTNLATIKNPNLDHLSQKLSALTDPLVTKAENLLGQEVRELTTHSKVYVEADMIAVIEAIDRDATPARFDQATSLAAVLIGKCRANGLANGPIEGLDFKVYTVGLGEAFLKFPASVGVQAVDGGTGIPSKSAFWPKPFDVVKFCEEVMLKRGRAKFMAQRHIDESNRRAAERQWIPPTPEQKASVKALVAGMMENLA